MIIERIYSQKGFYLIKKLLRDYKQAIELAIQTCRIAAKSDEHFDRLMSRLYDGEADAIEMLTMSSTLHYLLEEYLINTFGNRDKPLSPEVLEVPNVMNTFGQELEL